MKFVNDYDEKVVKLRVHKMYRAHCARTFFTTYGGQQGMLLVSTRIVSPDAAFLP